MVPQVWLYDRLDAPLGNLDPTQVRELTMTRQVNGEHALNVTTTQELTKHTRLVLRDGMGKWHEYVVQGVTSTHQDGGRVANTYYCVWSIQHDLSQTYVDDQYGCGVVPGHASVPHPASDGLACALEGTSRWAIGTVDVGTQASASFYRMTGWEGMQRVVERWGGEVDSTITVGPRGVVSRAVDLLAHLGATDATRRFDYAADMKSIKRNVLDAAWTCRIVPLGKSTETDAGGYTRRPTIASVNNDVVWLEDADAVPYCRVWGPDGWEYPVQIVLNDTYEEPADLKAWALEHITDYTRPRLSYEASVIQLERAGLDPHGVTLGDEVIVVDKTFGDEGLRVTGRVLKIREDLLDPSRTELTISNLMTSISSELQSLSAQIAGLAEQVESTYQLQETSAYMTALIDRLNAQANATGGYTYITEGAGIRTYDAPVTNPGVGAEATQLTDLRGGNIRFANTKDAAGNWIFKTLIMSGLIATDFLTASNIVTGKLESADGSTWWDLDNNELHTGVFWVLQDGILVAEEGQTLGIIVSDSGSFDVVALTWNNGTPTVGDTIGTLATSKLLVGNTQMPNAAIFDYDSGDLRIGTGAGSQIRMRQNPVAPQNYFSVAVGGMDRLYINMYDETVIKGQLTRNDTNPVELVEATSFAVQSGEDPLVQDEALEETTVTDAAGYETFRSQLIKTADGPGSTGDDLIKSFLLRRNMADDSDVETGFYLHVNSDGTQELGFANDATRDAWRLALGISWRMLSSIGPSQTGTFSVAGCTELLITATYSTTFAASVAVPIVKLTSSVTDWYLGGWSSGSDYNACCKLSISAGSVTATPYKIRVAGSAVTGVWTVYGR